MTEPEWARLLTDAFGRPIPCECCHAEHLLVATAERWIIDTADTPQLREGLLAVFSGHRQDARFSFCHECFCIVPLPH